MRIILCLALVVALIGVSVAYAQMSPGSPAGTPIGPGNFFVIGPSGGAGGGGSGPTPPTPCTDGALQYNVSCNVIFMTGIFQ